MIEKAVYDFRVRVVADSPPEVYDAVLEALMRFRAVAPEGVEVAYYQLRPARRSRDFEPTIVPPKRAREPRI